MITVKMMMMLMTVLLTVTRMTCHSRCGYARQRSCVSIQHCWATFKTKACSDAYSKGPDQHAEMQAAHRQSSMWQLIKHGATCSATQFDSLLRLCMSCYSESSHCKSADDQDGCNVHQLVTGIVCCHLILLHRHFFMHLSVTACRLFYSII